MQEDSFEKDQLLTSDKGTVRMFYRRKKTRDVYIYSENTCENCLYYLRYTPEEEQWYFTIRHQSQSGPILLQTKASSRSNIKLLDPNDNFKSVNIVTKSLFGKKAQDGKKFKWRDSPDNRNLDRFLVTIPDMTVMAAHRKSFSNPNVHGLIEILPEAAPYTDLIIASAMSIQEWDIQRKGINSESSSDDGIFMRKIGFAVGFGSGSTFLS